MAAFMAMVPRQDISMGHPRQEALRQGPSDVMSCKAAGVYNVLRFSEAQQKVTSPVASKARGPGRNLRLPWCCHWSLVFCRLLLA